MTEGSPERKETKRPNPFTLQELLDLAERPRLEGIKRMAASAIERDISGTLKHINPTVITLPDHSEFSVSRASEISLESLAPRFVPNTEAHQALVSLIEELNNKDGARISSGLFMAAAPVAELVKADFEYQEADWALKTRLERAKLLLTARLQTTSILGRSSDKKRFSFAVWCYLQ